LLLGLAAASSQASVALAQNNFAAQAQALAQRAAPYVKNAAIALRHRQQQMARERSGANGNNNNNNNNNNNGPTPFVEPPVDRPDRGDNNGCSGCGCGGCNGGGGGGFGAWANGINAGAIVGLAGAGLDGYVSLTQPIVSGVASRIPIDVPAVFADGKECRFGQPFQDPETGRLMCRLGDMGQVANYGYRALGVAADVGMQAANAFLGKRRRLLRAVLGAEKEGGAGPDATATTVATPAALPTLDAQQAMLKNIPLPSWAK
jgi:hypothetical protein